MKTYLSVFILILMYISPLYSQDFWQQCNGDANFEDSIVRSLLVNPGGAIFAGLENDGIYYSKHKGESFTKIDNELSELSVSCMTISSDGIIFAGIDADGGAYLSEDNGSSWISTSLSNTYGGVSVSSMAINSDGNVFAGTDRGVFLSFDKGFTYIKKSVFVPILSLAINSKDAIIASTPLNIYISNDNGETWNKTDVPDTARQFRPIVLNTNDDIFACTDCGMICSKDSGSTWSRVGCINNISSLVMMPNGSIIIGTRICGWEACSGDVFFTSNNGKNWDQLGDLNYAILSLAYDAAGYIYAGTEGGGVYKSKYPITSLKSPHEQITHHPDKFTLDQNYPNPFNPATMISYQLPMSNEVELRIYNMLGQKVAILVNEKQQAGRYQIEWDGSNMASGIYYYQLHTDAGLVLTKKMVLMK